MNKMAPVPSIPKDVVLNLWKSGDYVYFNGYLAKGIYPLYSSDRRTLYYEGKEYRISDLIATLINLMVPYSEYKQFNLAKYGRKRTAYYRGEELSLASTESFIRETFISLTTEYDQAVSFNGDSKKGVIFRVTIHDDVYCIETGIEKELLIEPNCYWRFRGYDNDVYHVDILPFKSGIPLYGEILFNLSTTIEPESIVEESYDETIIQGKIASNLEFFNITESDSYSQGDFLEDLKALDIDIDGVNEDFLFHFYCELSRKN